MNVNLERLRSYGKIRVVCFRFIKQGSEAAALLMDELEKPRRLKLVPDPALHGAGGVSFEPLKFKNNGDSEECPVSPASQGQQSHNRA